MTVEGEGSMTVEAEIGTVCFEDGEKWGISQGIQGLLETEQAEEVNSPLGPFKS